MVYEGISRRSFILGSAAVALAACSGLQKKSGEDFDYRNMAFVALRPEIRGNKVMKEGYSVLSWVSPDKTVLLGDSGITDPRNGICSLDDVVDGIFVLKKGEKPVNLERGDGKASIEWNDTYHRALSGLLDYHIGIFRKAVDSHGAFFNEAGFMKVVATYSGKSIYASIGLPDDITRGLVVTDIIDEKEHMRIEAGMSSPIIDKRISGLAKYAIESKKRLSEEAFRKHVVDTKNLYKKQAY